MVSREGSFYDSQKIIYLNDEWIGKKMDVLTIRVVLAVFFHLLPQTFMGEAHDNRVHFVLLEEKRNTLLGLAIMVGFVAFVILDKGMRIVSGGADSHGHDHTHSHSKNVDETATTSGIDDGSDSLRQRKGLGEKVEQTAISVASDVKEASNSIKVSSYLNMA